MNGCGKEFRLDAFHDGELNAVEQARVAQHLQDCSTCAAELEQMQRMSRLVSGERSEIASELGDVTEEEIARLHAAVEREIRRNVFQIDKSFWRTAGVLSGLAASVLIVASAWLMETPAPHAPIAIQPAAQQEPWERLALNLRADPLPYSGPAANPDRSAMADAHANMTNWMLENLKGQAGR